MLPRDTIISEYPGMLRRGVEKLKPDVLPPQQPRRMTRDMAVDRKPVNSTPTFGSYKPANINRSNQYIARNSRDKELRLAQVDIKDRLNKVDSCLRVLKARLNIKEEELRSRRDTSKSIMTAGQELEVEIEKAKEELSAKEKQAAARRTKKNDRRNEWAKKQMENYEQRETKRREQAKADSGVETASAGAAIVASCEHDFDIDVYGD